MDAVSQYLEETLAGGITSSKETGPDMPSAPLPASSASSILLFDKKARIIGELTARMHRDLAGETEESFKVEPFNAYYQRSLYQSFRGLTHRVFSRIEAHLDSVPEMHAKELRPLPSREQEVIAIFFNALRPRLSAVRMRIHGDYHLGQIMTMDEQYRICDLEGLSTLPFSERRLKRSPLRDIASMVHSFYCAAHFSLFAMKIQEKDRQLLHPKARQWAAMMSDEFVRSYLSALLGTPITSSSLTETQSLLRIFLLERALCDLERDIEYGEQQLTIAINCLLHYLAEGAKQ